MALKDIVTSLSVPILIIATIAFPFSMGIIYRDFVEFQHHEELQYGALHTFLLSHEDTDEYRWINDRNIEGNLPKFKTYFLRLSSMAYLFENYHEFSLPNATVMPVFVHPYYACYQLYKENEEYIKTLIEDARINDTFDGNQQHQFIMAMTDRQDFGSVGARTLLRPLDGSCEENVVRTYIPLLRSLRDCGFTLGLQLRYDLLFQDDLKEIVADLNEENVKIHLLVVVLVYSEPFAYDYNAFVKQIETKYESILQTISRFNVSLTIAMKMKLIEGSESFDASETQSYQYLMAKFLYRWGEEKQQNVVYYYENYNFANLEDKGHEKYFSEAFLHQKRPWIPAFDVAEIQRFDNFCQILKIPILRSKFNEMIISSSNDESLTRLLELQQIVNCGVPVSFQTVLDYQNLSSKDLSLLSDSVLNDIISAQEAHPAVLENIIMPIYQRDCLFGVLMNATKVQGLQTSIIKRINETSCTSAYQCIRGCFLSDEEFMDIVDNSSLLIYSSGRLDSNEPNTLLYGLLGYQRERKINQELEWKDKKHFIEANSPNRGHQKYQNCFGYKSYWNMITNWASIQGHFLVITGGLYNKRGYMTEDSDRDSAILKNLSIYANVSILHTNMETQKFLSNLDDICVVLSESVPKSPVIPNQAMCGVTFNFNDHYTKANPKDLSQLIELIHTVFNTVEVVIVNGGSFNIKIVQDIFGSDFSPQKAVSAERKYYLSIGDANVTEETIKSLNWISGRVDGIHINSCVEYKNNFCSHKISLIRSVFKKVGLVLNYLDMETAIQDGFQFLPFNYLIVDTHLVDIISKLLEKPPTRVVSNYFTSKNPVLLYDLFNNLRAFRLRINEQNPNITIFAKISFPTTGKRYSVKTFLRVWEFIHEFSEIANFPYFINQAFDNEMSELHYGWWRRRSYSQSVFDPLNFVEKQAEYYGLETKRPDPKPAAKENDSSFGISTILGITGGLVTISLGFCLLIYKIKKLKHQLILTKQEKEDFDFGRTDSSDTSENHIYGMQYDRKKYEIEKSLFHQAASTIVGTGNFGIVYKTIMPKFNTLVAVKIPKTKGKAEILNALREIKVMAYLGEHPNIVTLLGAYTREIRKGIVIIVTNYFENGSLLEHLKQISNNADENPEDIFIKLVGFCIDISCGMDYLRQKNVIHGDLATRNVLLGEHLVCKVGDFGMSKQLYAENLYVQKTTKPLPWAWLAIETFDRQEFSTKSDVWALGVTFWEIFTLGKQPYQGYIWDLEFPEKVRNGLRLPIPRFGTNEIYQEIVKCWNLEPNDRPDPDHYLQFFRLQKGMFYVDL